MKVNFEIRKKKEPLMRDDKYRIVIGSHFQDLTQDEAEALFEKMCDNIEPRCRHKKEYMTLHEEFEKFKKVPKYGLHKIPEHVLAISKAGYVDQSLLDVLCKQISICSYIEALNTIKTMHCLLGSLPYRISTTDKRAETILRLNSIRNSLTNDEADTHTSLRTNGSSL